MEINDQVEARLEKLRKLREMGINPYPYGFAPTHDSAQLLAQREALLPPPVPEGAEAQVPAQTGPEVAWCATT
jgi:lysyl-tRNA synthetase class II